MLNFFAEKMWVAFAKKATNIFSAKNIRILYIESAKIVNEMTLNELVKITTLWTTGPRYIICSEMDHLFILKYWNRQAWANSVNPEQTLHSISV